MASPLAPPTPLRLETRARPSDCSSASAKVKRARSCRSGSCRDAPPAALLAALSDPPSSESDSSSPAEDAAAVVAAAAGEVRRCWPIAEESCPRPPPPSGRETGPRRMGEAYTPVEGPNRLRGGGGLPAEAPTAGATGGDLRMSGAALIAPSNAAWAAGPTRRTTGDFEEPPASTASRRRFWGPEAPPPSLAPPSCWEEAKAPHLATSANVE